MWCEEYHYIPQGKYKLAQILYRGVWQEDRNILKYEYFAEINEQLYEKIYIQE